MKKTTGMLLVLMLTGFVCMAGVTFAGNGQGGNQGSGGGNGLGDGTGPIHDVLLGTPFDVRGDVVSIVPGQGLVLDTGDADVTVYGIGPVWYWETVGVDRPAVGDALYVEGFVVDYNGAERYIAMTITVGEDEVPLRDPETGAPLWRGSGRPGK